MMSCVAMTFGGTPIYRNAPTAPGLSYIPFNHQNVGLYFSKLQIYRRIIRESVIFPTFRGFAKMVVVARELAALVADLD
jgi:hypothetical protein